MNQREATLKIRLSLHDAHYAGNLVDGARLLQLFGDLATELLIRYDGDEGLFRAYESIEFLAPVYAGDFIEAKAQMTHTGRTSRKMTFSAYKYITGAPAIHVTAAQVLDPPVLVCRAIGTCVTPLAHQRIPHDSNA